MDRPMEISRKDALKALIATAAAAALPSQSTATRAQGGTKGSALTEDDLLAFERVAGIEFTAQERKDILESVRASLADFESVRKLQLEHKYTPAVRFAPLGARSGDASVTLAVGRAASLRASEMTERDIAFASIRQLNGLLRSKQISSVELTQLYLRRLKEQDPVLLCVVTLTEELALRQAAQADAEIAIDRWRGLLHGVPYGLKDLFATRGYPTTWGAKPYQNQVLDYDATVVRKMQQAGAVLVAKLSLGALAMDDKWFRGQTKNPWNTKQGSSGSSAGSASATAAGLVPFAIGTETQGSIMSPSLRCRTSGLRPSFGRISRHGAMELSYTMDKVGPIARSADDCAIVFAALQGADPLDPSTVNQPFRYRHLRNLRGLKAAYIGEQKDLEADPLVEILRKARLSIEARTFTPAPSGVNTVLDVECAAAFDELTRSGKANEMTESLWPEFFRSARHIPAVEYVAAQRARHMVSERWNQEMEPYDLAIDKGIGMSTLVITNQAGTPQSIIPFGVDDKGDAQSRTFMGKLYSEALLLQVSELVQRGTEFHRQRPPL